MLSDNSARSFIFGVSNYLTLPDRPVAAKTGTTNNYHDAWTVGYTPQLATGGWVGNSDNSSMKRGADGSVIAAPIWQKFMIAAHRDLPVITLTSPPPSFNLSQKPMLNGQWDGGVIVAFDRRDNTVAAISTPPEFIEEHSFRQVHSILHWVNRDNPLGSIPVNPELDPAYSLWEAPVERWRQQRGITNEPVPILPQNNHALPYGLEITSPTASQVVNSDYISVSARLSDSTIVSDWRFSLDGQMPIHGNSGDHIIPLPSSLANGSHAITITAITTAGDAISRSVTIIVARGSSVLTTTWDVPSSPALGHPTIINISLSGLDINQIDFYVQPPIGASRWVGVATANNNNVWSLAWGGPTQRGQHLINITITTVDGRHLSGGALVINAQ